MITGSSLIRLNPGLQPRALGIHHMRSIIIAHGLARMTIHDRHSAAKWLLNAAGPMPVDTYGLDVSARGDAFCLPIQGRWQRECYAISNLFWRDPEGHNCANIAHKFLAMWDAAFPATANALNFIQQVYWNQGQDKGLVETARAQIASHRMQTQEWEIEHPEDDCVYYYNEGLNRLPKLRCQPCENAQGAALAVEALFSGEELTGGTHNRVYAVFARHEPC